MGARRQEKYLYLFGLCVMLYMLAGCALNLPTRKPLALSDKTSTIDLSKESIALLTVRIANELRPGLQPRIGCVMIDSVGEKDANKFWFIVKEKYRGKESSFNEYLLSVNLPPGKYKIKTLDASSPPFPSPISGFPVVGSYSVPLSSSFIIEPRKIVYLGHINATIKERTDETLLRAGPVVPQAIPQAIAGASTGTFIINITDSFEDDMKMFQQKYPYLANYQVENHTLPPWIQPTEKDIQ
ncbi:MAG: hypothetical protein V2B20_16025 [Pseudomonadota bacterium]